MANQPNLIRRLFVDLLVMAFIAILGLGFYLQTQHEPMPTALFLIYALSFALAVAYAIGRILDTSVSLVSQRRNYANPPSGRDRPPA